MKTIQQIADELNISKATLYNRVKAYQISLNDLTSKKIKNKRLFDEESEQIIKNLFVKDLSNSDELSKQSNTVRQLNELTRELDKTRDELQAANEEINRLRTIEEQLHKQLTDLIETQKADKMLLLQQQANIKMLEAPHPREGLIKRAKYFIFGEREKEK